MIIDDQVRAAFREREMRVERTINRLRFVGLGVLVCADIVGLIFAGEMRGAVIPFVGGGVALFVGYSLVVDRLAAGPRYRPWLKYITIAVDHVMVVSICLGYLRVGVHFGLPPGVLQALIASSVLLLTLLGALRFGRAPVVYSTALGIVAAVVISLAGTQLRMLAVFTGLIVLAAGVLAMAVSEGTAGLFLRLRQREKLMRFLSRDLVDRIDAGAIPVELGGRTRTVTVLISDIRGFTTLSEGLDPQEVVSILNAYFTRMTEIVFAEGGTVDKFLGDGLLAVFGAPIEHVDHARRAVQAATRMIGTVEELNAGFRAANKPVLEIGIALHTGPAVSGIIGSPERMEYTVVGDTVNVTSRIESLNKEYGTTLLLTEATWRAAGEDSSARLLGETSVRGRVGGLRLYTLDPGPDTATSMAPRD